MKQFNEFIKESVLDIPRNTLDPQVFHFEDGKQPILNPAIKKQILADITNFEALISIKHVYMVGSILTKTYSANSDIDVNIGIYREDVDDLMQGKLSLIVKMLNGRMAVGTIHPINYYLLFNEPDPERFDAIYDIANERWIKEPTLFQLNVEDYLNKFQNIVVAIDLAVSKLRRELIDFDELIKLEMDEVEGVEKKIDSKLKDITQTAKMLIQIQKSILSLRRKAFLRPLSTEQKEKYKSRNLTPENIIYKLLHKYYYWDLVEKLEKILEVKKTINRDDIIKIKTAEKNFYTQNHNMTFEQFIKTGKMLKESTNEVLMEKIRDIKLKKVNWKEPKSSHKYKMYRGMNRQKLSQIPTSQLSTPTSIGAALSNIGSAKKLIDTAKKSTSGIWRLTPEQVKWISRKYHHIPPNAQKKIKHLGNTGIMVWRKARGLYFLVKTTSHYMRNF